MKIAVMADEKYKVGSEALQLCDEDFEIFSIVEEKETGKRWLMLKLPRRNIERKVSCTPQAIIRALISLGVAVRKELGKYLQEEIFRQKRYLQVIECHVGDIGYDSYYEDFIRFVWEHEDELQDENNLTKIYYYKEGNKAAVTLDAKIVRRDFFQKMGISDTYEQTMILRYWRERGWLLSQNSRKDALTIMASFNTSRGRRLVKAFKIIVPMEKAYVESEEKPVLQIAGQ